MRMTFLMLVAISLSMPLAAQDPGNSQRSNHYLDHVALGINDLDAGMQEVQRLTGVRPKKVGTDAQLGTHSAVIGLGDTAFLEIIAPDPKADPDRIDPDLKSRVVDRLQKMDVLTPFIWAIGTSNLERTILFARRAGSHGSEIMPGIRKQGWGRKTEWTWARVQRPKSRVTPIFIQWDEDTKPPQDRAPQGCTLEVLHVITRNFKTILNLAATMQIDIELLGAEDDSLSYELKCGDENVVFGPVSLMGAVRLPGFKPSNFDH